MSDYDDRSDDDFDYEESYQEGAPAGGNTRQDDKDDDDDDDEFDDGIKKVEKFQNQPFDEAVELSGSDNDSASDVSTPPGQSKSPAREQAQPQPVQQRAPSEEPDSEQSQQSEESADEDDDDEEEDDDPVMDEKKRNEEAMKAHRQQRQPMSLGAKDEDSDASRSSSDDDDDGSDNDHTGPGGYNPADFSHLNVSEEIQDLFQYINRYKPPVMELETKLKPFIPDYIPAVGDIDAFIKIGRPDNKQDNLGLTVLDEPAASQSDPTVLHLQLRAISKNSNLQPMVVRSIENADKNHKTIVSWVQQINQLHRSKPQPDVMYSKPMPDIESLMQIWPEGFEDLLQTTKLPAAELDVDLKGYIKIICALLDIPVYPQPEKASNSLTESVHVLFTLYSEFKQNQHFHMQGGEVGGAGGAGGGAQGDVNVMVNN